MTNGQRLKQARALAGHTQQEAADSIGVPLGTWRGWEQGRWRKGVKIHTIHYYCLCNGIELPPIEKETAK